MQLCSKAGARWLQTSPSSEGASPVSIATVPVGSPVAMSDRSHKKAQLMNNGTHHQVTLRGRAASAKKAYLLDQDNSWPTLKWNPEQKKQVPIPGQSIPMAKMVKQVEFLLKSSKDLAIAFQAMYAETAVESKPVVPWRISFSMRNDEHVCLLSLLQSSVWGLIGTRLKKLSHHPSHLTQRLQAASMNLPCNGGTLCFLLSCLQLSNNANWCYANASYFALCWAYGSCAACPWAHFDGPEHLLDKLRQQPLGSSYSLEAWFPLLFSHITWGVNPADASLLLGSVDAKSDKKLLCMITAHSPCPLCCSTLTTLTMLILSIFSMLGLRNLE